MCNFHHATILVCEMCNFICCAGQLPSRQCATPSFDNYGVVFDCVDIYKQPAFDHPLLKNHVLQMPPNSSSGTGLPTTGESCPYGTVPIRRTLKEDLVRGRALRPFALVLLDSEKGKTFQSASASIEVYYFPMPSDAASTAQMLVVDDRSSNVTVVQAGWHIDPGREGDGQSRLTVYWTADDYKQTGCPNMQCPGFVLVNQYVAPGTAFPAGSSIALTIFRTGHWLAAVNGLIVGYFPRAIVNGMDGSTQVQVGGTVYAPPGRKRPPMGSGIAPGPNSNNGAAKFKWLAVRGSTNVKFRKTKDVDDSSIYDVVVTSASQNAPDGFSFQYGGPGDA
ncbi:hypothetical protein VPH35_036275 [Triticum aestivum]|uniref:Neprosin PEP catalytic domain-containing protein n=1 Tax=Triticum aestivum TaxID=4565 RepID=A0A3B6DAX2_WHEAT